MTGISDAAWADLQAMIFHGAMASEMRAYLDRLVLEARATPVFSLISIPVMDADTCEECARLHGSKCPPPHGECTNPNGCRCTARIVTSVLRSPSYEPKPKLPVLMLVRSSSVRRAWIVARWYGKHELRACEDANDDGDAEASGNEEHEGEWYCPAGWYEELESGREFSALSPTGEAVGWIPLPEMPAEERLG